MFAFSFQAQVAKQNKEGLNEQLREALGVGARGSRVRARVVVGGGDGSVNWVMKLVRAAMGPHAAPCPLAVLPLGVGNELGRVTGWGHVCPNDLRAYLRSVLHASRIIHVDQWSVLITPDSDTDKEKANLRVQLEDEGHLSGGADVGVAARGAEDRKGAPLSPPSPPLPLSPFLLAARTRSLSTDSMGARPTLDSTNPLRATMSCFLSLGFDARIAYRFHVLRETHPEKCRTVEKNKLWHGLFGAQELFTRRPPVHRILRLRVDGAVVPLPSDLRTLQVFNIHSSADGTNFWGSAAPSARSPACGARCCAAGSEGDAAFRDPLIHDGLLEVCGTKGVAHLSRCHLGLSTAHRIAQGRDVRIDLLEPLEMQLDGEPWLQQPCSVHVTHRGTVPLLQGPHSLRNVDTASSVPAEAMT